jgi:flagellar basal body-associated protein FliL
VETTTKRRLGAVLGGIVLACVAGVALAAWLSSGSGTAEGTSTTAVTPAPVAT